MRTVHRACTICEAHCGLTYELEGDTVLDVRGDPDDVFSRGFVCAKGIANKELHADPDRLKRPVRRTSGGRFEPIGWDEALELAITSLRKIKKEHGRESVGLFVGNPMIHNPGTTLARVGLAAAIGKNRLFGTSSQDTSPRFATSYHLYGCTFFVPLPDLDRTDYLLCVGANPVVSNGSLLTAPNMRERLRALRQRGGRLVVVDPRRTETAREADEHVSVLPGGDAALLLAMLRVVLDEGLADRASIDALTRGFARAERAVLALSMSQLAEAAGVSADVIARLARDFARAKTSVVYSRVGVCNNRFGTLATYAGDLLNIAAGRLGAEGGALFARPALDITRILGLPGMDGHARWRSKVRGLPETIGELPGSCVAEEIETPGEGRLRGFVTLAGNPVLSTPNGRRLDRALSTLDFMVSIDPYVNETTRHAHVILPPASALTEEHMDFFFGTFSIRNVTRVSPPVLERRPDERHDWEIMLHLAEGLGGGLLGIPPLDLAMRLLRRAGVDVTPGHVANALLRTGGSGDWFSPFSKGLNRSKLSKAEHGVDLGPLQAGVHGRVTHRDRRVHVDAPPLVEALEAFARSGPPVRSNGELLLIGRRDVRSNNSWMHNLPSLAGGKDRCVLLVSPEDAKRAGLETGDMAWLESRVHGGTVPVRVSDEMRPGVVSLPHGWGHTAVAPYQRTAGSRPGVSVNDWADDGDVESVVGQSILNGVAVRLRRLEREAELSAPS